MSKPHQKGIRNMAYQKKFNGYYIVVENDGGRPSA